MNVKLAVWTVYDHPRDLPGHFAARRFEMHMGPGSQFAMKPTLEVVLGDDLEIVRRQLRELGLVRVARSTYDDPTIVETWL